MKVRILETKELKDLTIRDKEGIEWTYDLLGNNEATTYNKETEEHEMTQENYDWWKEYINNYKADEIAITGLAKELNIEESEINSKIEKNMAYATDLDEEHTINQSILNKIKQEYYVGKKWNELSEERQESLLSNANTIDGVTGNNIDNGECIIDLTDGLSIVGKIIDNEVTIDSGSVIYNPAQ